MDDTKKWALARARFDALRNNLPSRIDRELVKEYHLILDALHDASDEDLSHFRIPENQLKPQVVGVQRGTRRRPPVSFYSQKDYCNDDVFARQNEGLSRYLNTIKSAHPEAKNVDNRSGYEAMADWQLQNLAVKYGIPPAKRVDEHGEHFYFDRALMIEALVNRDADIHPEKPPSAETHIVNVHNMYGSSIQQGTHGSTANINFKSNDPDLRRVLNEIKNSVHGLELSQPARAQLDAEIGTIEAQLSSPHPRSSTITECLHTVRSVLEGVAGSAIASGLVFEITKLLAHHP
jgi:hypothetical protein